MLRYATYCALLVFLSNCSYRFPEVIAVAETSAVGSKGDAADDPAIYLHPRDPARHAIIGTDKQSGLGIYRLDGSLIRKYELGLLNNVDIRQDVPWRGGSINLVGATNRSDNSLVFYHYDGDEGQLLPLAHDSILPQVDEVYGFCLYQGSQGLSAYVVGKNGRVEQWKLISDGPMGLQAEFIGYQQLGSQCEGLVADDEQDFLFVAEETIGIWRFSADFRSEAAPILIKTLRGDGRFRPDVEGLAIYRDPTRVNQGYLLASIQGNNSYAVFNRFPPHTYRGSFRIGRSAAIDGTSDTDGIDVTSTAAGPNFPQGLFVAQDGKNTGSNQNFKLVDWRLIQALLD